MFYPKISFIQMESTDNLLHCPECPKTYKTKNGLIRHIKTKHTEKTPNKLTAEELQNLIAKASKKIVDDKSYPAEVTAVFHETVPWNAELLKEIHEAYDAWQEKGGVDVFFARYQRSIVNNATEHFPINFRLAALLAIKLRDILISFYVSQEESAEYVAGVVKPITEEERDGLQKLSGYLLQNILKKAQKSKKTPPVVVHLLRLMVVDQATKN